ncbi:Cullin-1 [Conglomerata obtusa]
MEAYNAIFTIVYNEGNFDESLYWLIGDFFYSYAKGRRKKITDHPNWFDTYCEQFKKYTCVVDSVNLICTTLNETLIRHGKGRRIDEFGYMIWEKCILQQLQTSVRTTLEEELLQRMIEPQENFIIAVRSLTKIVPYAEDKLQIYNSMYADKAMTKIRNGYKNITMDGNINEYTRKIKSIFEFENERRSKIFIKRSFPKLNEVIENVLISNKSDQIYKHLYKLLECDDLGLTDVYFMMVRHSNVYTKIVKDVIKDYIKHDLVKNVLKQNNDDIEKWFNLLTQKYARAQKIYQSCFEIEKDSEIDVIYKEKINRLQNPEFHILLAQLAIYVIDCKEYEKYKSIFCTFCAFIEKKSLFAEIYIKKFSLRLLTFRANFKKELTMIDVLKNRMKLCEFKKCLKMIKDMNLSVGINKQIKPEMKNQGIIDQNDNCEYFVSVLTLCAWPLSDTSTFERIILPDKLKKYNEAFTKEYRKHYESRALYFNNDLGQVDVEFIVDKKYELRLNTYQYLVLNKLNELDALNIEQLANSTGLKMNIVLEIIDNLSPIIIKVNNLYCLNENFVSTANSFDYKNITYKNLKCKSVEFDLKSYYKALIAKTSKKHKEIGLELFREYLLDAHLDKTLHDEDIYKAALEELAEIGIVEIKDEIIYYDV